MHVRQSPMQQPAPAIHPNSQVYLALHRSCWPQANLRSILPVAMPADRRHAGIAVPIVPRPHAFGESSTNFARSLKQWRQAEPIGPDLGGSAANRVVRTQCNKLSAMSAVKQPSCSGEPVARSIHRSSPGRSAASPTASTRASDRSGGCPNFCRARRAARGCAS